MSKFQHDVMLRVVKILNVLMIELPFAACWFLYYSHQTYANLAWEGHFAILGLFFILYIVLGKIYDAFWMSMQRVSELVYGQILGAMATDGILYIVICLMSAKFCNLLPGIAAIVGQLVMAAIWASCAHKWYYKTFPPQKTAVVYDVRHGIKHCKNELVARMDSDDIAYPDRCEKQIAVFNTHSEVSICSGIVEEFTIDPHTVDTRRVPPETNAEIVEFAKKRNPFNHPCVMYKKSAVEAVGSYQDFYLLEDYYLWLRMLMAGYQGYNIQEPLLHMRAGSDMYLRRAGWKYAKTQAKLFKFMKQQGFIGEGQYIKSCVIRSGSALAPNWLRKFMFERVLRDAG